ncbi:hypothetical protein TGME49_240810 [Toxoplasma gondii ME49]|uniref:Amino acid transporter 6-1 n=11 Tax=Toxoplasma gondii TaxID=5811 RepID=AT6_TOXGM|nr:hypothetical protein TGME49_240810 [Toxoplasma gondii ME49]EPR60592.1 hypothetical protein TGGT1_240810 [Toxoplasma gondii GT1]ESS31493.1 putative transporter [Toxoplasma gondii VEG]KAF4643370.1 hypothetical protein TGRH88_030360 [Toxoplasma gondii]KFG38695.1 putative transporter [Toxoplasma gondii p89]KFG39312.1 putative transporter [Toxoplasma gondii GAB2-2007-GAL-DOM2]KFG48794.1 putative transporter [Toxoplasma gondii FOU]KFG59803.1 putative transporter [Toxoplasma gondii RUB]KFH04395|eukprot:XP_002366700.1 hypothetical protein TGME49_240810 [Toxoplasma gondii ME49]
MASSDSNAKLASQRLHSCAGGEESSGQCLEKQGAGARLRGWLAQLLPRADLPGARQKTPFNLNRYVLLLLYSIVVFTTGAVFYGWTALSAMIFKNDGFAYLCPKDASGVYVPDLRATQGKLYICDEQDAAVQKLYTMTFAVACLMSAGAGTLLDWLGPLWTELLGQLLNLVGWLFLAFSTVDRPLYYPALVFIGLGADASMLPTLCIRHLFPGSTGLIITILGSAASASFGIPLVLNTIVENHGVSVRDVSIGYCFFGPVLGVLVALLFMPRRGFALDDAGTIFREPDSGEGEGEAGPYALENGAQGGESQNAQETRRRKLLDPIVSSSFWTQFFSIRYFLIVLYFVVVSWATSYYQQAARRMFSEDVVSVIEVLLPLSFIPCILLGKVADVVGIIRVLFVMNTSGLLTYVFSFFKTDATGYLSACCFMVYMSLLTSQVYVYVEGTFSPNHFGKLIGISNLTGGLLSLVSNPLYENITVNRDNGDPLCIQIAMTALLCVQYVWIFILGFLKSGNSPLLNMDVKAKDDADAEKRADNAPGAEERTSAPSGSSSELAAVTVTPPQDSA